ncbi:MAG: tRNA (adenosine(37)-N6)-dimethylallyltransferase MiaA [Phycisphaerales bacterium]
MPNVAPLRFPVIVGPTASGKSDLALRLVEALGGEIVSADAFQIFRCLDIGTAKPTLDIRARIPHHLIDILEPTESFSVSQWLRRADAAIADITSRARTPIVVGGTHLYIKALLDGLFEGPEPSLELRARLQAMVPAERRAELVRIDPAAAARIHPNDERRTVRALEVFHQTGRPISDHQKQWDTNVRADPAARAQCETSSSARHSCVLIGLEWESDALARRINARVRTMLDLGLVTEARALWQSGRLGPQAREALGYKQLVEHFEGRGGRATFDDAVEKIKIETRRLAKNQRTWLRRLRTTPGAIWIHGERAQDSPQELLAAIGAT